jgi:dTDP-4-amino-4,6-dideoxygalactose transaminase
MADSPLRIRLAHPLIESDEVDAVVAALTSGQLAQGPRVAEFEAAFAEYTGARHAVAVNSGTAALHLALLAHGIGPGDQVIVPAMSFAATANAVLHAGATPIFVDVRDDDFNIDAAQIEAAITPDTRAVIAVHLYGQPCDVDAVRAICDGHGLVFIEDAAQSIGATYHERRTGSFATGCLSFYATKNLTTGEGGMITADNGDTAEMLRVLRSQGERTRYVTEELGYNFRMMEMAAALGHAQLAKVDARNAARTRNAAMLTELLRADERIVTPRVLDGRTHAWHQYVLRVLAGRTSRDALRDRLRERGIESAPFYPTPIHRQPLYQRMGLGTASLPVAERLADEVLAIPVHPGLSPDDVREVAGAVLESL